MKWTVCLSPFNDFSTKTNANSSINPDLGCPPDPEITAPIPGNTAPGPPSLKPNKQQANLHQSLIALSITYVVFCGTLLPIGKHKSFVKENNIYHNLYFKLWETNLRKKVFKGF